MPLGGELVARLKERRDMCMLQGLHEDGNLHAEAAAAIERYQELLAASARGSMHAHLELALEVDEIQRRQAAARCTQPRVPSTDR